MTERHTARRDHADEDIVATPQAREQTSTPEQTPAQLHVTDPALKVVVETVIALARLVNPDDERVQKHIATLEGLMKTEEKA